MRKKSDLYKKNRKDICVQAANDSRLLDRPDGALWLTLKAKPKCCMEARSTTARAPAGRVTQKVIAQALAKRPTRLGTPCKALKKPTAHKRSKAASYFTSEHLGTKIKPKTSKDSTNAHEGCRLITLYCLLQPKTVRDTSRRVALIRNTRTAAVKAPQPAQSSWKSLTMLS